MEESKLRIEELKSLSQEEFNQLEELVRVLSPSRQIGRDQMEKTMLRPDSHIFVARINNRIAGTFCLGIYGSLTGSKACLEDVVVHPDYRGQGIAEQMLRLALRFLEERHVAQLLFTSRPSRVAANRLYQRMGFEQKQTNVYTWKHSK